MAGRDDFRAATKNMIAKRAGFICSRPDCRKNQVGPSRQDAAKSVHLGKVAHISAAAPCGPRYDATQTSEQRASAENGIYLCSGCADLVDKNDGIDYPVEILREWKALHEAWVRKRLNTGELDDAVISAVVSQEVENATTAIGYAGTINIQSGGITYADARDIANDVFEQNFISLSGVAAETAERRATEVTERFLSQLRTESPELLDRMAEPAMQYALFRAQKACALSGDQSRLEVLTEMLVQRCMMRESAFTKTVVSEAIDTAAQLTGEMIDTLALFVLADPEISELLDVSNQKAFIRDYVSKLAGNVVATYDELNYLATRGCIASGPAWERDVDKVLSTLRAAGAMYDDSLRLDVPDRIDVETGFVALTEEWVKSSVKFRYMHTQPVGVAIAFAKLQHVTGTRWDIERWFSGNNEGRNDSSVEGTRLRVTGVRGGTF